MVRLMRCIMEAEGDGKGDDTRCNPRCTHAHTTGALQLGYGVMPATRAGVLTSDKSATCS